MKHKSKGFAAAFWSAVLGGALVLASMVAAEAQTYSVLHNFNADSDGANPIAGVTVDAAGNLYGTASVSRD
jgi:hypothetical protein